MLFMLVESFLFRVVFDCFVVYVAYLHLSKVNVNKMNAQKAPRKKSIKLTPDEIRALKVYRKNFITDVDCAEAIGISRESFIRVNILGKSSPATVEKIRAAICKENTKLIHENH